MANRFINHTESQSQLFVHVERSFVVRTGEPNGRVRRDAQGYFTENHSTFDRFLCLAIMKHERDKQHGHVWRLNIVVALDKWWSFSSVSQYFESIEFRSPTEWSNQIKAREASSISTSSGEFNFAFALNSTLFLFYLTLLHLFYIQDDTVLYITIFIPSTTSIHHHQTHLTPHTFFILFQKAIKI